MKNLKLRMVFSGLIIVIGICLLIYNCGIHRIEGLIIGYEDGVMIMVDRNNIIYDINNITKENILGKMAIVYYRGDNIDNKMKIMKILYDDYSLKKNLKKNELFSEYYDEAIDKLGELSLEEKIGQLLLVRYPEKNQIEEMKKYHFGGYLLFEKDFKNKSKDEVKKMIDDLQKNSNIPLLIAVDEEGGIVVRVSSNKNIVDESFKSSSEIYKNGGMVAIREDTIKKSNVLGEIGINLNLAPVVDVSTNKNDYMYERTLKENSKIVSGYAKEVIEASKLGNVSYTLKHFPGYGNNTDTHLDGAIDNRSYDEIKKNDLAPFVSGIGAGAEAIMVSHNIVTSIDDINPAIGSYKIHNLLRDDLHFSGIVITDDIYMGAVKRYDNVEKLALLAGNDIIITTDYEKSFNAIEELISNGIISEKYIDRITTRLLAWKYYKGIM